MGKGGDQSTSEICFAFARSDLQIWVNKYVVNIGQRIPLHPAFGNEVKQLAAHHAFAHLAHVMKPYIPGPAAGSRESVCKTADLEVALQHEQDVYKRQVPGNYNFPIQCGGISLFDATLQTDSSLNYE